MKRWFRVVCRWRGHHTPGGSSGHVQQCAICDAWRAMEFQRHGRVEVRLSERPATRAMSGIVEDFTCPVCGFTRTYPHRNGGLLSFAGWRAGLRVILHMILRNHQVKELMR